MKKLSIPFVLFFLLLTGNTFASHLMGGEITWVCLPNGQFQFTMKIYRDCNSNITTFDISDGMEIFNYPTVGSPIFHMPITLISQADLSPQCNALGPAISCDNPMGAAGAVEEFVYQTAPITLTGTPPAEGWVFSYDGCCRNAAVTNIVNAVNEGFTLRAKMFAFNGRNTNPCFDSSPVFAERPSPVSCGGYSHTYSFNAIDPDNDSLSYKWSNALDDFSSPWNEGTQPPPLTYSSGYSATSPLPGTTQNPSNLPAVLNPATGTISYLSYTPGNFVTIVKVEAWKAGVKVAEIFREIQVSILAGCAVNAQPQVSPPGGIFTGYTATVHAGDLVTFSLNGQDPGLLPNGNPQMVSYTAIGSQFGAGFTDSTAGCPYPPCATLSPPPSADTNGISIDFSWQTDCIHSSVDDDDGSISQTYSFVFHFTDDFCPLPAENVVVVLITVIGDSIVDSPELRCASVLSNGEVELNWMPVANAGNTFNSYQIFHSLSPNGPFTVIDSIFNINTTTYTYSDAGADTVTNYFFIRTRSGCGGNTFSTTVDTIATILPVINDPGNGFVEVTWNPLYDPLLPSGNSYDVYSMIPGGSWQLAGSTNELTFEDPSLVCNDSVFYYVEVEDNSGCTSVSAIAGAIIFPDDADADFNPVAYDFMAYDFFNNSMNALDFLWDFGDGNTSTSYGPSHTFADTGTYTVTLTAWNACDTDVYVFPLTVTGIEEENAVQHFSVYPNPAGDHITIRLSDTGGLLSAETRLKIVSAFGQVVYQSLLETNEMMINTSAFSSGLYSVFLETDSGKSGYRKFVVE